MNAVWDPLGPAFQDDPYPVYTSLLEHAPLSRSPYGPLVVCRYEDCMTLLRHPAASNDFRKAPGWSLPPGQDAETVKPSFLSLDPPDHTRLRSLVNRAFTPGRIENLRPMVQRFVDRALDRAAECGRMDVVEDIAYPLPILVICEMLGVPASDADEFKQWSALIARGLDPPFTLPSHFRLEVARASVQAERYFRDLMKQRRKQPGDDLLSALLGAHDRDDRLTEMETIRTLRLLLIAGHETSVSLIANGILAFSRHPEQLALLRQEPSMVRPAVEEVLRFDPPVQVGVRTALEDIELSCGTIPRFEQPLLLLAAANRDPAMFSQPERFDIARRENRHLGFGFGVHHCLGAPLARLEGQIALGTLAQRFGTVELEKQPEYNGNVVLRGVRSLNVKLSALPRAARGHSRLAHTEVS